MSSTETDEPFRSQIKTCGLATPFSLQGGNKSGITLQVGINSDRNSQINFELSLQLEYLNTARSIGTSSSDYLSRIDYMIEEVSCPRQRSPAYRASDSGRCRPAW